MSQNQSVLLLYPHQLFPVDKLPRDVDRVFMIEDPLMFGRDPKYPLFTHKQKLVLHRASMRRYVEEVLWPAGYQVEYIEFHHMQETGDIVNKLTNIERVEFFDPTDDMLERNLTSALSGLENKPTINKMESPNFFLTRDEVKNFFAKKDKSDFVNFYQWQRERFNILIDQGSYKPVGGKLMHEPKSHKRLSAEFVLPTFEVYGGNKFVDEARDYVLKYFPDNAGSVEDFPWPTNHKEASDWLDDFLTNRLHDFATYEEAIDGQAPWVFHSAISPVLNIGLLDPMEVVERAVKLHNETPQPLESLEKFIRDILGWREFVRGLYVDKQVKIRTINTFDHQRHLTNYWYTANTGVKPLDDVIKKVLNRGYAHAVERSMILGNIMFLSEIHPDDMYRWFMEMFVDAYDWAVVPNVYSIGQLQDINLSKPNVSSSNYILSMSWYERVEWADVWDGLYWEFISNNSDLFSKNAHTRMLVHQLERVPENRRRIAKYRAEDFLREKTAYYI